MMKQFTDKTISLSKQLYFLQAKFPQGRGLIKRDKLVWSCRLGLDEVYGNYTIKILYDLNSSPKVYVIDPNLYEITGGIEPPHIYIFNESTTKLCLYLPSSDEWTSSKFLSDTIVPWASLWFMYFTGWLATGKWYGGGEHPEPDESFIKGKVL
ncbi:hypothetical protein NBRC116592_15700 [Colwellia sp. KU-HH00111]|uniref:hypothetical protein n=1 Tax=Colwellia sp. KU-HH00111 TaxID=3127652 RepID=UPI00310570E8